MGKDTCQNHMGPTHVDTCTPWHTAPHVHMATLPHMWAPHALSPMFPSTHSWSHVWMHTGSATRVKVSQTGASTVVRHHRCPAQSATWPPEGS